MVLRPVEFHAARNPRSCKPYQRRLDHILAIKKIVSRGLVLSHMDASTQPPQNQPPPKIHSPDGPPSTRAPPAPLQSGQSPEWDTHARCSPDTHAFPETSGSDQACPAHTSA